MVHHEPKMSHFVWTLVKELLESKFLPLNTTFTASFALFSFLTVMCLYGMHVCVHVHMYGGTTYTCVCGHICEFICSWKANVNVESHPPLLCLP